MMRADVPPLSPGRRVRIIDGNHFSGTEHRLEGTREHQASPLPGQALAILEPQYGMITNVIPCEDGHPQKCAGGEQQRCPGDVGSLFDIVEYCCGKQFLDDLP